MFQETPGRGADGQKIDEKSVETPGQKPNAGFVDLMEKSTRRLAGGMPIKAYLARTRGNWDRYLSGDPTPAVARYKSSLGLSWYILRAQL